MDPAPGSNRWICAHGIEPLGQPAQIVARGQAAFICAGGPDQKMDPERMAFRESGKELEHVSANPSHCSMLVPTQRMPQKIPSKCDALSHIKV